MNEQWSPKRWANALTTILNAAFEQDRFPVNVSQLALDYSRQRFPDDPITHVMGGELPGFEGALIPAANGKKGWGIIYNSAISSPGRINFTLAHEFGHYLLHRLKYPDGFTCGEQDMASWDSEYRQVESQANDFAATLLMPLDDFRRQIEGRAKPDLEALCICADRYNVSLMASVLRWLQYTERRAILVVSRDGFILWARSSTPALKTGAYFRTVNQPPISIPPLSLAAQRHLVHGSKGMAIHDAEIWLKEPCEEAVLFSGQYDFTISLLHLGEAPSRFELDEDTAEDTYDRMTSRTPGSSWLA
ncbi:hypothetical protein AUC68_04780 [Methyloceanibacter methanicus]|uniref:IrrE N-terminal-like domain-containing protein n=1 Tax=Methyloceanibacter methanicus TaxID=1774968 RepID=A0A1E3W0K6_9HYPH|nr:ImmA/IrrE family metallo-endopeptidase [Methyloceanibacter methanicus]ODR99310.1 hypothetical protein AUC68_04780 [Methyloceanibacter methanicus]